MIDKVKIRMYRIGTGDFFLLQFKKSDIVSFNLMIDCGCINAAKSDFSAKVEDLSTETNGVIDLLIVTHEHADHINGFEKASEIFNKKISFKKVWFAWTESNETYANTFRKEHAKVKIALQKATILLNERLEDGSFQKMYATEHNGLQMNDSIRHFVSSLTGLSELNPEDEQLSLDSIPTMEDILRKHKVIKGDTIVEFKDPGDVVEDLENLEGIRFFILGPPIDNKSIKIKEVKGEGYEKREKPSTLEMAFLNIFNQADIESDDLLPFSDEYILNENHDIKEHYQNSDNYWRTIDNEWLMSAGSLALRHETSINNTSLAMAIQFINSERILLFPGDAEHGNWLSWHNKLEWSFRDLNNKIKKVNAEYILNNTVFYKVGHHLSQNGTPKEKGLELMKSDDFSAMVTLDFDKINAGWLNTMPNDLIGSELIRKTQGKLFFVGDRKQILKNIATERVIVNKTHLQRLEKLNKPFDGKFYIDHEITG